MITSPEIKYLSTALLLALFLGIGCMNVPAPRDIPDYAKVQFVASDENSQTLKFPGWVYDYAFSPEGNELVTATYTGNLPEMDLLPRASKIDDVLSFWNLKTHQLIKYREFKNQEIDTIAFSPDGKYLVGLLDQDLFMDKPSDIYLYVWDAHTEKLLKRLLLFKSLDPYNPMLTLTFSPQRHLLAVGSFSKTILLDTTTWKTYRQFASTEACLAFSQNGKLLAGITSYANMESPIPFSFSLWNTETGKRVIHIDDENDEVIDSNLDLEGPIGFLPDGHTLIIGGCILDTRNPGHSVKKLLATKILSELNCTEYVNSGIRITPNEQIVALMCKRKGVKKLILWNLKSHKIAHVFEKTFPADFTNSGASFSPDGKRIALRTDTTMDSDTLQIWNISLVSQK